MPKFLVSVFYRVDAEVEAEDAEAAEVLVTEGIEIQASSIDQDVIITTYEEDPDLCHVRETE